MIASPQIAYGSPGAELRAPPVSLTRSIAARAADCLNLEVETWPKPGLVSHVDCGSHTDMDAATFRVSAAAIQPYFQALAEAGAFGRDMARLRIIGLEAEAAMFAATSGINTHRGAIFGMGLLCAAAGARANGIISRTLSLGEIVSCRWGADIPAGPVLLHSHGEGARRHYGAGGARAEAAQGFPTLYDVGLPALRMAGLKAPGDAEAQRVEVCFALIAAVEDTNVLHRGGLAGLHFARKAAQEFLNRGGVGRPGWRDHARAVHEEFVARRLSPGGAADLLAMTLFAEALERTKP